jgi:GDP-4-dehydro-6-deoxy-D-mannose reductase
MRISSGIKWARVSKAHSMSAIRLLITGANGFVGRHLMAAARSIDGVTIVPTARHELIERDGIHFVGLDVEDPAATRAALRTHQPTHVLHLAGIATAAPGTAEAIGLWQTNVTATIDLASAILAEVPHCWLMFAGSGLVYGDTARTGAILDEAAVLAPTNAYAATKAAADLGLGAMVRGGLKTLRFRPFNHTGAGQSEDFAVPSFAAQIARIEAGMAEPVIRVGDLSAERDFLDVSDVVAAYLMAMPRCEAIGSGTILNLASGVPRRMQTILDSLLGLSRTPIRVEIDLARLRPGDIPRYVGCAKAAYRLLGWQPRRSFDATLADVLIDQRSKAVA